MPYGFTSPGGMASSVIQELLLARALQERQAEQDRLAKEAQAAEIRDREEGRKLQLGQQDLQRQQEARVAANQLAERERTAMLDERDAADRRQAQNRIGVMQMAVGGVRSGAATPRDAQLMALSEGVELPDLTDPEVTRKQDLADYEERQRIAARYASRGSSGAPAAPQQEWVMRNGTPTPIPRGTAQMGDTPYDQVAARSAQPVNNAEAIDTAKEVQRIARTLRNHPSATRAFGVVDSVLPTFRQDTADAEELRESLSALLTLENMSKMKGVLSDKDMQVLRAASSILGSGRVGDQTALNELDRLDDAMSAVTGDRRNGGGGSFRVVGVR